MQGAQQTLGNVANVIRSFPGRLIDFILNLRERLEALRERVNGYLAPVNTFLEIATVGVRASACFYWPHTWMQLPLFGACWAPDTLLGCVFVRGVFVACVWLPAWLGSAIGPSLWTAMPPVFRRL